MSEDNKSDKSITRRSRKIGSPRIACLSVEFGKMFDAANRFGG